MSKIKEIKKIESPIKEIPKKIESIDDEFEEKSVENSSFVSVKRFNKTSTLDATGGVQDTFEDRRDRVSKEDRDEINFRPSYLGRVDDKYKSNNYVSPGSSESSGKAKDLGERRIEQDRNLINDNIPDNRETQERNYVGKKDSKRDRR